MKKRSLAFFRNIFWLPFLLTILLSLACSRSSQIPAAPWSVSDPDATPLPPVPTDAVYLPIVRDPSTPIQTPTPDPPRLLPTPRSEAEIYTIQAGDTLGKLAARYGVSLDQVITANNLANPNILEVGQVVQIPPPILGETGTSFKIIPDSELVFGPLSSHFDIAQFIKDKNGYLNQYQDTVDEQSISGNKVIERISQEFSVNPRLLLAVLEYRSGWVTRSEPDPETLDYPMGVREEWRKGLYQQLAWAANNLNLGYYQWRVNAVGTWVLADGAVVPISPVINAGTAGVQHLFAMLYDRAGWDQAVMEGGLFSTYQALFGYPFDFAVEPLLPGELAQPKMQLPLEPGVEWAFTGGPHGGWGSGSAWAALDFAPGGEGLGCVQSDLWVVAVANGLVIRADQGAVIQDLDTFAGKPGDGLEQTGWVVLYMHIEGRDRVKPGTYLRAGERIGHPSCEGGISNGTHLHLARRYNGEWIPADQTIPFVLDGWVSRGTGNEYDGYLERDGEEIEAINGYFPENTIKREP